VGLLLNALGGLVLGVIAYFLVPIVVARVLPDRFEAVRAHYERTAMGWLERGLLIKRKHGGWILKRTSFDAAVGKEKTTINGETRHFEDVETLMSRFRGYPLGLAHESSGTIMTPRYAELGEALRDRAREGRLFHDEDGETYVNGWVRIADRDDRLVNLDHALPLMSGSADAGTTEWSAEITKLSQAPFKSGSIVDYLGGVVAFGVAFGAFWLASEVGGGGGGGGVDVTIGMLGIAGVVV